MDRPSITAVIVSYRCPETLEGTLRALLSQDYKGPVETIIVDNASGDGTPDVARRFPGVRLVELPENVGFARANNVGVREGTGEYVLILNPDAVLPAGLLGELARYLDGDSSAGAVGPTLVDRTGKLQRYCARRAYTFLEGLADVADLKEGLLGWLFSSGGLYPQEYYERGPKEVFSLSGSCALIRREAFEAAGGFDERYFLFGEDVDLFRTIHEKGFKVVYLPVGPVVHLTGTSMGAFNPTVGAEGIKSAVNYNRKYRGRLVALCLASAAFLSLSLRYAAARVIAALKPQETSFSRRARYYGDVIKLLSRRGPTKLERIKKL